MIILLSLLWLLIGLMSIYILIIKYCHAKKVIQLKKDVERQRTKYETWRGYMNKGYRIAHDKTYAEILLDRINK